MGGEVEEELSLLLLLKMSSVAAAAAALRPPAGDSERGCGEKVRTLRGERDRDRDWVVAVVIISAEEGDPRRGGAEEESTPFTQSGKKKWRQN